jgi:hypothetical protein
VGANQHTQHAESLVVLNEAHAAHVSRELKNAVDALDRLKAGLAQLQVKLAIIGVGVLLVPLVERLDIDRAHTRRAQGKEFVDQMATDKTTGTAD